MDVDRVRDKVGRAGRGEGFATSDTFSNAKDERACGESLKQV